jgi:death-on-curing protein
VKEPRWLSVAVVLAIHEEQLSLFGGSAGVRDQGLLESAVARPQQNYHYGEERTIPRLAASREFALTKNHPFVDGNKRVAFLTAYTFLLDNGYEFTAGEAEVVAAMLELASSNWKESDFVRWIESNSRPADR